MKKSMTYHYWIAFILFSGLMLSCGENNVKETPEEELHREEEENSVSLTLAQSKNAGIRLGKVAPRQISGTIRANGVLDVPPQQLVSVSVPLGGFLKNTVLLQGSRVRKGQVIATIENLEFIQLQQDYLEAKSQFELAAADYKRQRELSQENVNSQKTLQQAKSDFTTWQARYNGYRAKLKMLNLNPESVENGTLKNSIHLYAPIDGYVTEVNVNIGKFVNPTDVLFEIVDTEHLHVELVVFEKDVLKLKIGQKVRFTLANEAKERLATVYLIGRQISDDRTIRIHCHIDEEDKELLPGMYLSAIVETGGDLVPALPDQAIINYEGVQYVFIANEEMHSDESDTNDKESHIPNVAQGKAGQQFIMLEVRTGDSEDGYTQVTLADSIAEKDIVVEGAYALLSKIKNSEEEGGHAH